MKYRNLLLLFLLLQGVSYTQNRPQLKTASGHPMQYYVSLPNGFTKTKTWPVVFVLEAAEKEFEKNAQRFVEARGDLPFIIVAPINTNNGNQGRRDSKIFPYSKETWDYIDKVGDCDFNLDGIHQIMLDIQKEFNAEDKIYITGFEAGGHDMWSVVFNHPEYLKAVAAVAGNFRDRCTKTLAISPNDQKKNLPIRSFIGAIEERNPDMGMLLTQWQDAKKFGSAHGFQNFSETVVLDKDHGPMPKEVLNYFNSLQK